MVYLTSLGEKLTYVFKEHHLNENIDDLTKEQLEKLTEIIEIYMAQWNRRDSYSDFRMFLNIYLILCLAAKKEPKDLLSLVR